MSAVMWIVAVRSGDWWDIVIDVDALAAAQRRELGVGRRRSHRTGIQPCARIHPHVCRITHRSTSAASRVSRTRLPHQMTRYRIASNSNNDAVTQR